MRLVGTFTRVSPSIFAEKTGIPLGWAVVSTRMADTQTRRANHGKWFKIATDQGKVYRVLRFSPRLSGNDYGGQLVLDYPGWLELIGRSENDTVPATVRIEKARWWAAGKLAVSHPDPAVRLAGWLAILSFGLGMVSVILGVWSIALTLRA